MNTTISSPPDSLNKRATFEFDGEVYEEHQTYDPLMVSQMWGYDLHGQEAIGKINGADKEIKQLIEEGIIKTGEKVLVGGAGEGSHLFSLRDMGVDAFGIERNIEMVKYISTIIPNDNLTAGNMSELLFPDKSFAAGFFHSSLFMNESTIINKAEVKEIKRVLKPGGVVVIEGANGVYWEPIRKAKGELSEYRSVEEALWALGKDHSLAQWRRRKEFIWLEFLFITVNTEQIRVNHVYHFVPKQTGVENARYYHEVVNYEPFEYRIKLLNEEGFINRNGGKLTLQDIYETFDLSKPFSPANSPGGVIVAKIA